MFASVFVQEFEAQQHELEALQSCCSRICFAGGVCGVLKWYPSYGAVLLQSDKEDGSELHQLMIVRLDKWVFNVHMYVLPVSLPRDCNSVFAYIDSQRNMAGAHTDISTLLVVKPSQY